MDGRNSKSALNFNKQLVLGEIGALTFAPFAAFLASKIFSSPSVISKFAVAGSILGAAIFWISTRIIDNSDKKGYAKKELLKDMTYFTPAAFLLTLILYYPVLYFLSEDFITYQGRVVFSVISAQLIAFSLFLTGINIYRIILMKFFGKQI